MCEHMDHHGPLRKFRDSVMSKVLRSKFRRLFYVPGNRDLALNASEAGHKGLSTKREESAKIGAAAPQL